MRKWALNFDPLDFSQLFLRLPGISLAHGMSMHPDEREDIHSLRADPNTDSTMLTYGNQFP